MGTRFGRRRRLVRISVTAIAVSGLVAGAVQASADTGLADSRGTDRGAISTGSAQHQGARLVDLGTGIIGTDVNGNGRSDVAVTGVAGWNTLPVARSNGNGSFAVTNAPVGPFASWAATAGAKVLSGDFNGDGRSDVALTGAPGWNTVPVARSLGNGSFSVTNAVIGSFAAWTASPGAQVVTGDFNGDNRTDIAVTGVAGWNTLPVAFSRGNGSFRVTNLPIANFAGWTASPGAKVVTGDFNRDNRTDIAVTGVAGWATLPLARSNGNGTFTVTNGAVGAFAAWAASPGAKILTGDFNADNRTDVAVTGVAGWNTLPMARSHGNGQFTITNAGVGAFATWTASAGAKVLTGDFNGDRRTDVAVTGVAGWNTLPVARSFGSGSFAITNTFIGSFAAWTASAGAKVQAGDFNGDGRSDVAVTGVTGWNTLPLARSNGNGSFAVTNAFVGSFATWTASAGAELVTTPATAPR